MTEDMIADKSSYVDLGLSVKWATCNLGANAPEEFGDYYAWGETRPKETFTDENYKYETGMFYSKYNLMDRLITLEPHDDAAVVARAIRGEYLPCSKCQSCCLIANGSGRP